MNSNAAMTDVGVHAMILWILSIGDKSAATFDEACRYLAYHWQSLDGAIIAESQERVCDWFTAAADELYREVYDPTEPEVAVAYLMNLQDEWRVLLPKHEPMMSVEWIMKRYR